MSHRSLVSENGRNASIGQHGRSLFLAAGLVLPISVGTYLRLKGIFSAFWLDEIWSLKLVRELGSPLEVVTKLHIDNNHIINSLYMYMVGDTSRWYLYRIPCFLAGAVSLYLVWLLKRKRDRVEGIIAVLLFSLSYLMVIYSSEARGYSLMVFSCLLSLLLFRTFLEERPEHGSILVVGFWLASMFGLLAHLTFLHFYLALAVWSIWVAFRSSQKGLVRKVLTLHSVPVLFFALMFYVHIRHIPSGTGPILSYALVLFNAMSVAFGGFEFEGGHPYQNVFSGIVVAGLALATVVELFLLWRKKERVWILYVTAIIGAPALTLAVMQPRVVFIRYFMVSILFLYLTLAGFIARVYGRGMAGKTVCAVFLALYCIGQMQYLVRFHSDGRGDYLAAMRHMASSTPGRTVTISSDNLFRNGLVIDYYQRFFKDKQFSHGRFFGLGRLPEWWLLHSFDRRRRPEDTFWVGEHRYQLEAAYPHTAISGWSWFVYRRHP
jgi:hypothetical protein